MRALRPQYRLARKSARGKDFRHLRIKRAKSAPFEKVHVRNLRALRPRYRLARKSVVALGFGTAPRGSTELAEVRVITPRSPSCLSDLKIPEPPVFRTERFPGPPPFRDETSPYL